MPVFTATATALLSSTALAGSFIATNLLASGLAYGVGHLLGAFDVPEVGAAEDQGVELRLAANTQNRIPTLYGEWMERGRTVYAEVSEDKQNYHTVIALGEGPVDSIDKVFWNEYELTFNKNGVVTDAVAADGTTTNQLNGNITVQTYLGTTTGNNSTYLEGLSETWTSTDKMTGIVYAVVSLKYNRDDGVTSLADMRFVGTSPVNNPADAIQNLLTNSRYGLGLSSSDINTASFAAARTHYNDMVDYVDLEGDTVQQKRHEVNGSISTSNDIINRIQTIGRGCSTELVWSDGQWGLFVNKEDNATTFEFTTDNIIGNVQVVEPGLNSLFNRVEVNYGRNADNNYQRADAYVEAAASVLYPNELTRTQTLDLPLVATSQEAKRVATLNINQARQQLTVSHTADATAMPLEAGDIVSYTDADYGWSSKLFRITSITEVNEESSLTYQVTAIEYADAVYDFVVNEDDVAPNVPENDVAAITAVDDLTVVGAFPAAATPNISLQWTVPENSLVESFTVFYNIVNTTFDSNNTKLGGVERVPLGAYTIGDRVSHSLIGVPAGDVSIWVVATNDFVSSSESNRANVTNWNPTVNVTDVFETVNRYNETPSVISGTNIDVGAPPANATGIGTGRNNDTNDTGWYEFDPEDSDRNNAPVWTATAEVVRDDVEPRVIDFTYLGTAATQTITFTPETQITDFTLDGTIGNRTFFYNARPEKTDFTITGQGSDYDIGVPAEWSIVASGDTESTGVDATDVFYILPAGTTDTFSGESFTFTPAGNTSDGVGPSFVGVPAVNINAAFGNAPSFRLINNVNPAQGSPTSTISEVRSLSIDDSSSFTNTFVTELVSGTYDTLTLSQTGQTSIVIDMSNSTFQGTPSVSNVTASGPATVPVTSGWTATLSSSTTGSSVSITLDSGTNSYTLADNLSGGATIGAALNTAIGTDFSGFTKTFNATTGAITFTADDLDDHTGSVAVVAGTNGTLTVAPTSTDAVATQTSIQLEVTTESIDETILLSSNITGAALRAEVNTLFNAIGSVTDEFTVELADIDIDGTTTEVVRFTANDFVDHTFTITVNSGITETSSGTITDGNESETPTTIRVSYDDSIAPSFQDITFTAGNSINAATELVELIDGHGGLSAVQGNFGLGIASPPTTGDGIQVKNEITPASLVDGLFSNTDTNLQDVSFGDSFTGRLSAEDALDFEWNLLLNTTTITVLEPLTTVSVNDYVVVRMEAAIRPNQLDPDTPTLRTTFVRVALKKVTNVNGNVYTVENTEADPATLNYNDRTTGSLFGGVVSSRNFIRKQMVTVGPDINDAYSAQSTPVEYIRSGVTGNAAIITNGSDGPVDEPTVTITTQGTGDISFAVDTETEGVATSGTPTSYSISYSGMAVASGNFTAAASNTSIAAQLRNAMNSTSQLTATLSSNVITATSTANSASNTLVTITQGTNKSGGVSTNDAASTGDVTQLGSAVDVFGGADSVVNVLNGGAVYYTNTYDTGDDISDIVSDLVTNINIDNSDFSNFFTAAVKVGDTDSFRATSDFVGTTPTLTLSITPGSTAVSDAIGNITVTGTTLNSTRTEVSDGQSDPIVSGVLSTYSVSQGGVEVIAATNLSSGITSETVATTISSAIALSESIDYTTVVDGTVLTTTSDFNDTTPDLVITITAGTNSDLTGGDLAVSKVVTQTGNVGSLDLTDATWVYAVTSPTTDGDTTMITGNGTIAVRRGLFLNSLAASRDGANDSNSEVVFANDLYTTATEPSIVDITGVLHFYVGITAASDDIPVFGQATMQYTTDTTDLPNATWTNITGAISNRAFVQVASGDSRVGAQQYVSVSFAADNFAGLTANTQYAFRVLLEGIKSGSAVTVPTNVNDLLYATFQLQEILTTT